MRLCSSAKNRNTLTFTNDLAAISNASGISRAELTMLDERRLHCLQHNLASNKVTNHRFCRSQWYPFPRDLSFPPEKRLFRKWADGRMNLVEIGVFEAASSLIFRSVMAPTGTLHLIDPYVVVPDSGLTARPWMAHLNVLRSRNGQVVWHRDYSGNVAKGWQAPIDFLFIDGDHAYHACNHDWELWHAFVVPGGVVLFHDARLGLGPGDSWDGWPGPSFVVDELFRGTSRLPQWNIVDEAGSLIVV